MRHHFKKKKLIISISLLLVCCIIYVIGFYGLQPQIVTGKKSELQGMIIFDRDEKIYIDDQHSIYALYDKLKHSHPIKEKNVAEERAYTMVDSTYRVVFCYSNKEETVYIYHNEVVRFLNGAVDSGVIRVP